MKKYTAKILITILFISPLSIEAEITDTRLVNENVAHDAGIILEMASFDASSSSGVFNIIIEPGTETINASGVLVDYATSSIEILGILTGSSYCDFFLENSFNNSSGSLSLSGMKPYPGIATRSLFAQVLFQRKDIGTSTISISKDNSMVLANNGFGTNILATTTDLEL